MSKQRERCSGERVYLARFQQHTIFLLPCIFVPGNILPLCQSKSMSFLHLAQFLLGHVNRGLVGLSLSEFIEQGRLQSNPVIIERLWGGHCRGLSSGVDEESGRQTIMSTRNCKHPMVKFLDLVHYIFRCSRPGESTWYTRAGITRNNNANPEKRILCSPLSLDNPTCAFLKSSVFPPPSLHSTTITFQTRLETCSRRPPPGVKTKEDCRDGGERRERGGWVNSYGMVLPLLTGM